MKKHTREQLFERLEGLGIAQKTFDHPPIMTVDDGHEHWENIEGVHCKNLFLKDAKGAYWLVVTPIDREVNLKAMPERMGSKRISFARAERLREILGLEPGSVTPFGLINDDEKKVNVVLDKEMMSAEIVNYHPLENNATTSISPSNLLKFIESCGHDPRIVELRMDMPA
ncbi:MAG: prolyl-tRNA synthetase associated domain-containing protein [Alphaproteobacteria bacterium]|nr:prolyl-tRNA synthetase associated domain-containing protein [Rhodospirillales bacterium]MCW9045361.1 prolyl-tRNA synthetase associated domain-containing protein [Alphaproteobacteria bacterium]